MLAPEFQQPDSTAQTIQQAIRFLRVVWHRRIVVMGTLLLCGMLGGLYFFTATKIYEADAQLLVVDTSRESLGTSMTGGRDDLAAMATYEKLVSSPLVLQAAVQLLDQPTRALFQEPDPELLAEAFGKMLKVRGVRQTNILELRFRSPHQEASAAVVAAIIRAYATFMDESHRGTAGTLVDLLKKEKEEVDQKIEAKQAEFLAVRQRVGDLGIKADGKTMHPLVERAIQLNAAMIETQKRRLLLQASYQSLSEAIQSGRNIRQSLVAIEETLGKEAFLESMGLGDRDKQTRVSVEKQLLEDKAQLDTLLEYYGDNHPKVIERRRKIEQMEGYLAQFDVIGSPRGMGGDDAQLANTIATILRQRLEAAQRQEQWLAQSFEQAKQDSIGLTSDMSRLDIVEHDLRWLRELRNTLLNQIASVDLRQENGGVRTTVVREATVPLKPVSPKLSLTILAVLA
ncbi:MAG: Wzz/FepE/Etk N-terminal domain-containing protein, partial [Planctomycetota bacterium]|nr:Wzz/FepE/Etk N-terminal domain-containing protein [Planctomycetota bacterium]